MNWTCRNCRIELEVTRWGNEFCDVCQTLMQSLNQSMYWQLLESIQVAEDRAHADHVRRLLRSDEDWGGTSEE